MKICILNSVHPATDTRVKRVAETLAEPGNEITIIAPSDQGQDLSPFADHLKISCLGLTRRTKGNFQKGRSLSGLIGTVLSRIAVCSELYKAGRKIKADVYHCNEVDSWLVGILLSIVGRSRVVFDVHEYYPARVTDVISGPYLSGIAEGLSRFLFQVCALFSDGLIFVNHSLVGLYGFQGKSAIVRNCVRKRDFHQLAAREELRRKYQGRVVVLHIGSLREQYGPRALLDSLAFIEDPGVLFLVLGGAGAGFWADVESGGHGERVEVIDALPFDQMLEYLAVADIGITPLQPSDKNTFYSLARKFLEYIAAGIPVIVSDFPEYRSLINQFHLGLLVDPEDPREIAGAIRKLAQDVPLRKQMGQNAARAFDVELNWELESTKLFDLYDNLRKK